jgi:pyridoxine kinase
MSTLCKHADVITPNLTELCLLCGVDYDKLYSHVNDEDYTKQIADLARVLISKSKRSKTVVVTGIISTDNSRTYIGNLAVTSNDIYYVKSPYTEKSFSGTGDLFASVIIGCLVKGVSINTAIDTAVNFLQPAIEEASRDCCDRNQGVYFEKYLGLLTNS